MKFLIVRFSSIGDIVLTTPVVRALKTQVENATVHFITKPQYATILSSNPYVDKVWTLDEKGSSQINELRKEQYDWVIDLHSNLRSRMLRWRLRRPSKSFKKLNALKWLWVNFKVNRLPNRHIVDRYMDTVAHLDVKMDTLGLDYFIPDKEEVENSWLPPSHQQGYVAVAIGGQHTTKKLPTRRLIELCDRINKPIVLLGGKEDESAGAEIEQFFQTDMDANSEFELKLREELGKKAEVYNGCGKFSLNQSASILKNAMVVFSHDTGLMHIAAALGKKIYSIWGNTAPEFGMYPYRTQFVIFENKKLSCRPCSKIGFRKCPKGHFKCMNELVFDFYIPD
ncbi:MAG: glycosyltransferase family 9 protein [Bacteroidota bacterium]